LDFVCGLIDNEAQCFESWPCFHLQARKAPSLVDHLDRAIPTHWAQ